MRESVGFRSLAPRASTLRMLGLAGVILLAVACGTAGKATTGGADAAGAPAKAAAAAAPCASGTCWVDVTVATAWVKPWYPRAVDKPELGNPAHPLVWVTGMSLAQKEWLVGRLETQALYGTKVTVIGHWNSWSQVAIPSQPTNRDARGYPGWIPTVQLTSTAPPSAPTSALVRSATAWMWSGWNAGGVTGSRVMLASYDTSFAVVTSASSYVVVRLIGGQQAALRRSDVILHGASASWGVTRSKVVAEARRFLGLQYLWAGTSGFGFDCSGFTYSVYRAYGITLSRDADQQAVHGARVARSALEPGDLVFFAGSAGGAVGHVGMYIGSGQMIDAPHPGAPVRIDAVSTFANYAGARSYLPS